jgi:O-antigen ligase/tetratricopeptide (TPR) repeat protein
MAAKKKSTRRNRPPESLSRPEYNPSAPSTPESGSRNPVMRIMFCVLAASLFLVVIALTPFTHNLDDIKVPIFLTLGPILMLLAIATLAGGKTVWPSRWITAGLSCYLLVMFLSTLTSKYNWAGWYQIYFVWSALGFFLAAHCIGAHRNSSEKFLGFLVILLLATNLVGCFMFDFLDNRKHFSGVAFLFRWLYGNNLTDHINQVIPTGNVTPWFNLLFTMSNADSNMQATILSRDFYAAFCVLYLPFALLVSISPGPTRRPILWRSLAILAALLSIICIFECKSKGEWIFGTITILLLLPFIFRFGALPATIRRNAWLIILGMMVLLIVMAILQSPILFEKLKSIPTSIKSRTIIWAGSLGIFQAHPLLGSGPGTFFILFPQFRAPDYYLHEISNVTLYSHNYFLDLLCETGLFGLTAYLVFLGALWFGALRQAFSHPDVRMKTLLATALIAILGIFGSNLSSPNGRWVIGASSLWTVLGYLSGLYSQSMMAGKGGKAPESRQKVLLPRIPDRLKLGLAAGLACCLLVLSVQEGKSYFQGATRYANGLKYMAPILSETRLKKSITPRDIVRSLDLSAAHFTDGLDFNPNNVSTYYKLGSVYVNISKNYQLMADRLARDNREDEAAGMMEKADRYIIEAKKAYEKLLEYHPDYAEIHFNMGIVYPSYAVYLKKLAAKSGNQQNRKKWLDDAENYQRKAADHLERMVSMSNKIEVALRAAGQLETLGRLDRALEIYRETKDRYPDDLALLSAYMKAADRQGSDEDIAEARFMLWQLAPADRKNLEKLVQLAEKPELQHILLKITERLSDINPLDPLLHSSRIVIASREDDHRGVLESWGNYLKCGGKDEHIRTLFDQAAEKLK